MESHGKHAYVKKSGKCTQCALLNWTLNATTLSFGAAWFNKNLSVRYLYFSFLALKMFSGRTGNAQVAQPLSFERQDEDGIANLLQTIQRQHNQIIEKLGTGQDNEGRAGQNRRKQVPVKVEVRVAFSELVDYETQPLNSKLQLRPPVDLVFFISFLFFGR